MPSFIFSDLENIFTMNAQTHKKTDMIKGFIFALTLLGASVFFSVYSLLGKTYEGSESSPAYIVYMIMMLALEMIIFLLNGKFTRKQFFWLLVPLAFVLLAWLFSLAYSMSVNISIIRNAILWQYTGILLAFNINYSKVDKYIGKSLVVLMFMITFGSVFNVLIPYIQGSSMLLFKSSFSSVGSSFQAQSYYIAYAAGINLFFFCANAREMLTKIISYMLLGIQFLCAILYAGRGAMVLALIYLVLYFLYMNNEKKISSKKVLSLLFYVLVILAMYVIIRRMIDSSNVLQGRFERVFSYIGSGGIDLSQTSNRDSLYPIALKYILASPAFGYGILGYMYLDGLNRYPHNFVLEFLIEGGIIYMILWICIIFRGIKRIKIIRNLDIYKVCLVTGLFAFIKLSFSATYSYEMLFWFFVVFSNICKREVLLE